MCKTIQIYRNCNPLAAVNYTNKQLNAIVDQHLKPNHTRKKILLKE